MQVNLRASFLPESHPCRNPSQSCWQGQGSELVQNLIYKAYPFRMSHAISPSKGSGGRKRFLFFTWPWRTFFFLLCCYNINPLIADEAFLFSRAADGGSDTVIGWHCLGFSVRSPSEEDINQCSRNQALWSLKRSPDWLHAWWQSECQIGQERIYSLRLEGQLHWNCQETSRLHFTPKSTKLQIICCLKKKQPVFFFGPRFFVFLHVTFHDI